MAYKLLAPFVPVKNARGKITHHLLNGGASTDKGPIIPWLNDEQRSHFLRHGLVEEIGPDHPLWEAAQAVAAQAELDAAPDPTAVTFHGEGFDEDAELAIGPGGVAPPGDLVRECSAELDRLGVASSASNTVARAALRDAKVSFGNETIAASVRHRKMRSA